MTRAPPLLLGAGLLFWGWQTGFLAFAVPMALLLEAARRVAWRWEFDDRDFNRLADLSNVLFLGVAAYLFSRNGAHGVFAIVQWLPLILFPLAAAQLYSSRGSLGLGSLFLSLRRAETRGATLGRVDLTYPYFCGCLIAASAVGTPSRWFFPWLLALVGWALAGRRPQRYSPALWAGLLLAAAALGYAGQFGLRVMQGALEQAVLAWFENRTWDRTDPYQTSSAIGYIGRLKFSDRIVLNVRVPHDHTGPLLLRQASYQHYGFGTWSVGHVGFAPIHRGAEEGTWRLAPAPPSGAGNVAAIAGIFPGGRGLLPLPGDTYRIGNLEIAELKQNRYGAVRLEEGPGFLHYRAYFGSRDIRDGPPETADLAIPEAQEDTISRVAGQLQLHGKSPEQAVARIRRFFADHFTYTLFSRAGLTGAAPLADFLLHVRSGHCEYFATAGVLLLRAAGIPARYAVGYSVQEPSPLRGAYLVRRRDAHAWALAYLGGSWQDLDFTPAVWAQAEQEAAPWWLPAYDLMSWGAFLFEKWRWGERDDTGTSSYLWLLVPLTALLAWRLYRQKKVAREQPAAPVPETAGSRPGGDSAFFRILRRLELLGLPRRPGEPPAAWVRRLARSHGAAIEPEVLADGLHLHYRYRFDPKGLTGEEQQRLQGLVERWCRRHPLR